MRFNESPRQGGRSILMLANEYPPATVGGLGRAVCDLSRALARQGHKVHVVTGCAHGQPAESLDQGVMVHRARPTYECGLGLLETNLALNVALTGKALEVAGTHGIDVIHAHDWLVVRTAKALKSITGIPLIATVHATEHGRNNGIRTRLQESIHSLEWELTYQASAVIACSDYMAGEVCRLFSLPCEKVHAIPNGVGSIGQPSAKRTPDSVVRGGYALPWEKVVMFVGRMVWEKGVDVLLDAIPSILSGCPKAKFVIAGTGPMLQSFRHKAECMGLGGKAYFPGFLPDSHRDALYRTCSAAVFPSLYEPFGIVALEAMALGAPVIVSATGGLGELVRPGMDGLRSAPGDPRSLADAVVRMLKCPDEARAMALRASERVRREFSWDPIARRTAGVYESIAVTDKDKDVVAI